MTNCSVLYGYMGFPSVSVVKNLPTNAEAIGTAGVMGSIPESPGERNDNPLQYSCWDNPVDREAWQATIVGLQSQTRQYAHMPY